MKKLVFLATTIMFTAGYTACGRMEREHDNNESREQGIKMHRRGMMNRGWGGMMNRGRGGMMQGGMMHRGQGGMMQGMMGHNMPMKKYGMMVNHLPNLQNLFSLSDEQVENLLDLQTGFKKQQIDYRAEWRKKQIKLNSLLADNASASQVKKQMETCFETKIKMKVAAYETAGKMKAVLNSDQKKQLNNYMTQGDCMMNRGQGGMMNRGQGRMMNRGQGRMMQNRRLYNADDESKSKTKSK